MRRLAIFLLALGLAAVACTGAEPEPRRTLAQIRVTAEEVRGAVEDFDPDDRSSIHRLNRAAFHGENQPETLSPLLGSDDPTVRWAALYVLALVVDDAESAAPISALLDDPSPMIRLVAAGALSGLGVAESVPVLIESLSIEAPLPFSDPPRPATDLARESLEAYTGETFATPAEWAAWLDAAGELEWDGERYVPA